MAERLRFGGDRPRSTKSLGWSIVVFTLAAVALGWTRGWWGPGPAPAGPLFEIRGDVPRPGVHAVDPPTLHGLLRAAGAPVDGPDRALEPGEVVTVGPAGATTAPTDDPLIVGLPLDPDHASAAAIDAVPGISTRLALAIVADREARGPFGSLRALRRVKGVGDDEIEALAPFFAFPEGP